MSRDGSKIGVLAPLVGYHLRRASGAFAADFIIAMNGTGMRQILFGILSIVSANPGINQGAVGNMLNVKRANMVALVNELVERGLVERVVSPDDRRAFALSLTPAGKDMLGQCLERIAAHEASMLSDFSEDEKRTLIDLLGRIEAKQF